MKSLALSGMLSAFAICHLSAQPAAQPASPDQKTILFVAGPKDHGAVDRHEYQKDLTVLKYCVDNMGLKNVRTRLYNGKAPDVRILKTATAIVLEGSGDRTPEETHPLLPQDAVTDHKSYDPYTTDRLKQIDELMKGGMGIVSIHYSTWINNELGGKYWLDWLGGVAPWGQDSKNVLVAKWSAAPVKGEHPILRGITPWTYDQEEFFFKETMPPDPRRTPLLAVTRPTGGDAETVSWAVERQGGGRGFVFTGSDFHKNMEIEQHRRMLLNGVLWAAKVEIPQGGASCTPPPELLK